MSPDNLERARNERTEAYPPALSPIASPATDIVQSDVGDPSSSGDPQADCDKVQVSVVRREPADERRRFLSNDPRCAEGEVRSKPADERDGLGLRRRSL
jgi:hypothetical protein